MVQVSPSEIFQHAWLSSYIAVDTEGTDAKTTSIRYGDGFSYGVSIACRPPKSPLIYSTYFPIAHTLHNVEQDLVDHLKILVEKHKRVVFHNAKYDILALETLKITRNKDFYDTMLMAHWLHEEFTWSGFGLDWCTKHFLDANDGKKNKDRFEAVLKVFGWHPDFPAQIMGEYAAYDTELTLRLFEKLYPEFRRQGFDGGTRGA